MKRTRTLVLSSLVASGLVMMIVGAAAQDQPAPPAAARGNFLNNFTGNITVGNTKDMSSSRIKFDPGARTNWHLHSAPQLLLVEEGRGRLQQLGEPIKDVPAGQPVLTKANVLHWHGAAPDQSALQFSVYSGTLEWKEKVTDEEYTGKTIRRQ
ncbi:MAG TPA: cupin domain-containing protein [Vicinamibacterales bacterium]|nr:cupin domain-containing protein [Vicinamibacterales bacterium]